MTEERVRETLIDVLREISEAGGHEWNGIDPDAKPIGALEGFDSLSAIEATVMVEEKLDCKFELDSIFLSDSGGRALTVKEIVSKLAVLVADQGATI